MNRIELLNEVLQTVPMAAALLDRDLRYLAHNPAWLTLHGEPAAHVVIGRSHPAVFPDLASAWGDTATRCLAGQLVEPCVFEWFDRAEGRRNHLRWTMRPWRDAEQAIVGLLVYGENITEQHKTEQRLAERESLIRDLFEQSPIGLNLCRMDGLWLESNPAFLGLIGYTQAEADGGLTYWQLTPRSYDVEEEVQLEELRTHRRYGPYEKEFIRKDGRRVPVRLHGFVVRREGVEYIWSLIEDLTAQRALEASLEEERLKAIQASKLAALGEMAASFAHEINNPLAIIDAFAFGLESAIARGDGAFIAEAVTAMRDAVARAGKIVHGLRRFARESRGEAITNIQIADVVHDALDLCRARMRTHGVHLDVEVTTAAQIEGHAIELSQVFVNLLNNAFDAASGSDAKWVRVRAADVDDRVEVAIEDSGPGVPPHLATDVFRPFFTTKAVGAGLGLGLGIGRNIVERHAGTLQLESSAPNTRFVVSLPRKVGEP